jgi:hypothetical protein
MCEHAIYTSIGALSATKCVDARYEKEQSVRVLVLNRF